MPKDNSNEVRIPKIGLSRDDNLEFYEIVDKHNRIMDKWNTTNNQLHELRYPKIFLFCQRARLKSFYGPIEELHKDFIKWNVQANRFLERPSFVFSADQDKKFGFIHYENILINMINRLESNMRLIAENFVKVQMRHHNQVNFVIAISSFVVAMVGLGIAAFALIRG